MARRRQHDPYAEFRAKSKDEQREYILQYSSMCIDGAGVGLARMIEIYLDATPEDQLERREFIYRQWDEEDKR